jgi:hypothetical protein
MVTWTLGHKKVWLASREGGKKTQKMKEGAVSISEGGGGEDYL